MDDVFGRTFDDEFNLINDVVIEEDAVGGIPRDEGSVEGRSLAMQSRQCRGIQFRVQQKVVELLSKNCMDGRRWRDKLKRKG